MKIKRMIPEKFKERVIHKSENKQTFISLYFKFLQDNSKATLEKFSCIQLFLSAEEECKLLTKESITDYNPLASNQPEADTRIILHASRISEHNKVVIASPSGDTDIIVLAISLLHNHENVIIMDGWGDNKRVFDLSDVISEMDEDSQQALIGLHDFIGNDYSPVFFRKGEKNAWH